MYGDFLLLCLLVFKLTFAHANTHWRTLTHTHTRALQFEIMSGPEPLLTGTLRIVHWQLDIGRHPDEAPGQSPNPEHWPSLLLSLGRCGGTGSHRRHSLWWNRLPHRHSLWRNRLPLQAQPVVEQAPTQAQPVAEQAPTAGTACDGTGSHCRHSLWRNRLPHRLSLCRNRLPHRHSLCRNRLPHRHSLGRNRLPHRHSLWRNRLPLRHSLWRNRLPLRHSMPTPLQPPKQLWTRTGPDLVSKPHPTHVLTT